ncbi:patatin-like phospholipase family protein [Niabella terrae]
MRLFRKKKRIIGLTLSGGGLRGIAHLGVIKAMEERNMAPQLISGSSAGAIIGAFYAGGYGPDELIDIVTRVSFFSARSLRLRRSSLFDREILMKIFKHYLPEDFSQLKIPLYVAATDIVTGKPKYFSEGALHDALMASASIPFVFPVARIREHFYLDGGIINNLPVEPIREQCSLLVGVNVNAISHREGATLSGRSLFDQVIHLTLSQSIHHKARLCDLFINPPDMTRYSMFDKKNATVIFQYAYEYACGYLDARAADLR